MATFSDHSGHSEKEELHYDLQNLCLLVIINNFDRYCATFNKPNSKPFWKYWEFLVRRYTQELLERLLKKLVLSSQHIDVLINPYLKELDITKIARFDAGLIPQIIERLKIHGSGILSLRSSCSDLKRLFYEPLMSSLPNVEKIDFSTFKSSEICRSIGRHCVHLKHLKLHIYEMRTMKKSGYNEGIAFVISRCPCLEIVQYEDSVGALYELHKIDLAALKKGSHNFKNLSKKRILKRRFEETDLNDKEYALRSLSSKMGNYKYPLCDALEICSVTCPYVSELHIDNLESDGALENISHFTKLQNVEFCRISDTVTANCYNQFLSLRGGDLISLEMPYASCLSIPTLIDSCPKLKSLKLCNVGSPALAEVIHESSRKSLLLGLETFEFTKCDFKTRAAVTALNAILSAAKNIKIFSLMESSGLTNEFIDKLDLYNVHELDLSLSDVEMCPLKGLISHGNLKKLNIEKCRNIRNEEYFRLARYLPDDRQNSLRIMWSSSEIDRRRSCMTAMRW